MRCSLLLVLAVLLSFTRNVRADDPAPPKGFTALFNGKDLSGWHGTSPNIPPALLAKKPDAERKKLLESWNAELPKYWKVVDGDIVSKCVTEKDPSPVLTTDKEFGDFELRLEVKAADLLVAGVGFRGTGLILFGKPGMLPKPGWNQVRVVAVGDRVTVYLNGKPIINHVSYATNGPLAKKGPIWFLSHERSGEVHWRNIFIREIAGDVANAILRSRGTKGFVDVFNGKDFEGWAGPIDQYEVKDGAIVCKPRKGGTIFTKKKYADFVARLEYRLPPGGNNGLAIRYPGSGDTAYVGMCEIQVLDDTAKQYARLDPRQYNGSAYGMTASHRGYLRPVGEWNFEEVTVKGSTIKVELNGSVILDTDLSKVTKYMANSPHPGKTRTEGHFGFAGHSDPVAFRNIQIRVLEKGNH